jgi:hypothetical protein
MHCTGAAALLAYFGGVSPRRGQRRHLNGTASESSSVPGCRIASVQIPNLGHNLGPNVSQEVKFTPLYVVDYHCWVAGIGIHEGERLPSPKPLWAKRLDCLVRGADRDR